jgi:hypothetical protein
MMSFFMLIYILFCAFAMEGMGNPDMNRGGGIRGPKRTENVIGPRPR